MQINKTSAVSNLPQKNERFRRYHIYETLLDGRIVEIRAIQPDDKAALQQGLAKLSLNSSYHRFFHKKRHLSNDELHFLTDVDFVNHVALVAGVVEAGSVAPAGVGRYIVLRDQVAEKSAEIAFAVSDEFHGLGIATLLLKHLVVIARSNKIENFVASVLSDNYDMFEVFEHSGYAFKTDRQGETTDVRLNLT